MLVDRQKGYSSPRDSTRVVTSVLLLLLLSRIMIVVPLSSKLKFILVLPDCYSMYVVIDVHQET